jgi:hypothetical protein
MDAADAGKTHKSLRHTMAGLEAGVTGSLLMIVWSMIASLAGRRSVWAIPNLYATVFYGPNAYQGQFLRSSWSGLATMVAFCGVAGAIWGLAVADRSRPSLSLIGALTGLAAYYVMFGLVLRHTNPLIPLYAPERQVQVGFVLWGLALSRSPRYCRKVE